MVDRDYIHSIDSRLSKIESDVSEIKAKVSGLTVRVASIAALIGAGVTAFIKWLI